MGWFAWCACFRRLSAVELGRKVPREAEFGRGPEVSGRCPRPSCHDRPGAPGVPSGSQLPMFMGCGIPQTRPAGGRDGWFWGLSFSVAPTPDLLAEGAIRSRCLIAPWLCKMSRDTPIVRQCLRGKGAIDGGDPPASVDLKKTHCILGGSPLSPGRHQTGHL